MEVVGTIAFDEVLEDYLREHPVARQHEANTNGEGAENLRRADRLLGVWSRVRLSRAEVLDVVLPWHLAEGGERELVPRTGLTVGGAAARVRAGGTGLARANPACAAKLALLGGSPPSPVFLSTRPVEHPDYADLRVRGGLVHVDGLHRMLAWELAGRLPDGPGVEALVAGPVPTSTGSGS